jgi:hypothetical protein
VLRPKAGEHTLARCGCLCDGRCRTCASCACVSFFAVRPWMICCLRDEDTRSSARRGRRSAARLRGAVLAAVVRPLTVEVLGLLL